eukprot:scaffold59846_cov64-Phaeocystis_antarctica.AAC.5
MSAWRPSAASGELWCALMCALCSPWRTGRQEIARNDKRKASTCVVKRVHAHAHAHAHVHAHV